MTLTLIKNNLALLSELDKKLATYDGWVGLDMETQSPSLKDDAKALKAVQVKIQALEEDKGTKFDRIVTESKLKDLKAQEKKLLKKISSDDSALCFWKGYPAILQLAIGTDIYIISLPEVPKDRVKTLLSKIRKVMGHNLKFDFNFIKHHYDYEFSPVDTEVHDSYVTEALTICGDTDAGWVESKDESSVKARRRKVLGLKHCLKKYFYVDLDKTHQAGTDWDELDDEKIKYCALDVWYLDALRTTQMEIVEKLNLTEAYKLEMATLPALVKMETNGCVIDLKRLKELHNEYKIKVDEEFINLVALTNNAFDFNSTKEIKLWYLSKGIVLEDAQEETLVALDCEVAKSIVSYRKIYKVFKTYLDGWLNKCVPICDTYAYLYPSYNQLITSTGRLSCEEPNIQNIPSTLNLRELFVPHPDWSMIGADLSQVEVRIGADFADEQTLLAAIKDDQDTHQFIADMTGQPRKIGKALNLAVWYNKTAWGIAYDLDITQEEGESMLNAMYTAFPGIKGYQQMAISEGRNNGCVRTKSGRLRWVKYINSNDWKDARKGQNAAVNSKIQGTAADGMKRSLAALNYTIDKNNLSSKIKVMLSVHDEIIALVKGTADDKILRWFEHYCIYGTQHYCPKVVIKVGDTANGFRGKVLTSWSDMK